ncbi:MAG: nuclear transport factor 2 family protein [Lysobacterales bacterium]|jgi:steroid delta-isomerase-like uncharacterized protein
MQARKVVLSYVEAFNRGDLDRLCALFSHDALVWGVLGWGTIEQVRPIWKQLIECLDMKLQVEGLISEGDTVAVRFTERGCSRRPFQGFEATGKAYEITAMEWFEIQDDKIRRRWGARDSASQYRQMGFSG